MPRLALACLLLGGCALGPGAPFATLTATFEAALVAPPARALPDGWQRLDTDYHARFTLLELELKSLELLAAKAAAATFDPAHPPPGYTLCHGGHCHREDGALIPYEQIAAELAGGGGSSVVVSMPLGPRDLLAGGRTPLECQPGCDLPLADITRMRLTVTRVRLRGFVRDSLPQPRIPGELPFRLDAALASAGGAPGVGSLIDAALDAPADRRSPPLIRLDGTLQLSGALLDGVDWASVTPSGGELELSSSPQASLVLRNLEEGPLGATVSRSNP